MITKITNDKQTYDKQFNAINAALERSGNSLRINSLEDYFSNIRTIASLTKPGSDVKGKFLVMPLDEPFFKIDANARTIEVPTNFKKNGIAVQNDHWAEILYFKIDRYYDYQDLASLNIFINWEFIPAGSRNSNAAEVVVSNAFAPDPDFEPNSLIFGWVVSREMTPSKGTLKFSVTFTDSTNPSIPAGYQLNTLVSSVVVNEGLVPGMDAKLITVNDNDFFARITNSAISSEGMNSVLEAVAWKALPKKVENGKLLGLTPSDSEDTLWLYSVGETSSTPIVEKSYFPVIENEDENAAYEEQATLTLGAEAVTPDIVESLDYLWATSYSTSEDLTDANTTTHFDIISAPNAQIEFKFVETNDTTYDINTTYYKKNGADMIALSATDASNIFSNSEDNTQLYERICLRTINRGGYYTVWAQSTTKKDVNILTNDTTVQANKTYKKLENGVYVTIAEPESNANPKALGWYEATRRTCNSPIQRSNKFVHVPNAEVPEVAINVENVYTPEIGNYEILNNNTVYNYIDINRTQPPKINLALHLGENNDGIGGIAWKIGDPEVVNQVGGVAIDTIIQNSIDRSNSEFATVGTYKHVTDVEDLDYDLYATERENEEYHLRVFNQRNHTYAVTDDITAMKLSYVAPKISAFDVTVVGGIADGVKLLEAGESPDTTYNLIQEFILNEASPSLTISIAPAFGDNNSETNALLAHYDTDALSYKYILQEVDYNPLREGDPEKRENARETLAVSTDTVGANEVEVININSTTIPENDTGYYRIKVETYYHDTKSIAYTDMFSVSRR